MATTAGIDGVGGPLSTRDSISVICACSATSGALTGAAIIGFTSTFIIVCALLVLYTGTFLTAAIPVVSLNTGTLLAGFNWTVATGFMMTEDLTGSTLSIGTVVAMGAGLTTGTLLTGFN